MYTQRKILSYDDLVAKNPIKSRLEKIFQADSYIFIFFAVIVLVTTIAFGIYQWYDNNKAELPYYGNPKTASANSGSNFTVPQFSFTNQDSKAITSDFVKNKVWVADYFFTSCGSSCPKLTHSLKNIQTEFSNDNNVRLMSFSVDPTHDTPARLTSYAKLFGAKTGQWQFLTGDKKELYRFARNGLFISASDGDGGPNDFIHSSNLILIDKEGYIRGYYDGTEKSQVAQLIKDIKRLKNN